MCFGTMPYNFRSRLNDTKRRKHVDYTFNTANNILRTAAEQNRKRRRRWKKDLNEIRSMAFTCLLALNVRCIKGQVEMRECSVKRKIHYYWNTVCIRSNDAMCHISRWPYAIRSLPFMCNAVFGICNFHMKMALCSHPARAHSISFGSSWAR